MKFTRHTLPGIIGAVLLAGGLAACGTAAANGHPAATSPAAAARPVPHKTTQAPATTAPAAQATQPASGSGTSQDAATGIVYRYIQLLNSQDFQDAWNMGGDVLSHGVGYDAWVAGYSGTAKTTVQATDAGGGKVPAHLTVLEDGGTYDYYQGYYYVDTATGTITGASIQQDNADGPAQQPAQPAQGRTAYWLAHSGQWYVHGLQLQITQGSSGLYGTMTWNAGGNIWTGTAHLAFALQPDGSLAGTFTDNAAYTQAGQSNPDGLQPDPGGPQQGQVLTLMPVAPMHASVVLGSNSPMMLSGGNLNLCQQGLPDASQFCGA